MVKHSKGYRTRTRKLLTKNVRERGAVPRLSLLMEEFKEGDYVVIKINPSIHKGMPHRRYHGKVGVIQGKRGKAYIVRVTLGDKEKVIIVRPEHLAKFNGIKNG
ncbi:50S ribosomal protein L21e [Sulfurisphaera ohwakuensis]|uniref:Large ribosomal subunit protein eL21 n=1 Tax=Sulfurisphaera ohwakuensis TaxID=69656 RepID=A0A650CEA8_SULOH|nr:50S ribosomal protein L21e [Sulfurisphaera ohwakuensis]MBB5252960.1 large subunit ribosomal protein L21e [Sulfurisphaera ohwakuensis]QGR16112.1 50S ribosomal protein L21e [Sulfurisphaera ohwakuensis]